MTNQAQEQTQPKRSLLRRASRLYLNTVLGTTYLFLSLLSREPNPLKWREAIQRKWNHEQLQQEVYNDLSNQLFGEEGLADIDNDGRISFLEKIDAFERAGCVSYGVGPISIRQVTTNDLQRAVDSYKSK